LTKYMLAVAVALAPPAAAMAVLTATPAGAANSSTTYVLKATLDTKHEVPAPKDAIHAKGVFTGKLTLAGKKSRFTWRLRFSNLSGRAVSADLHFGRAGKTGGVALPLCHPCLVGASGAYTGAYVASATFRKPLLHKGMYVTVRTRLNRKGEIRGQITATPA
jgi:CHRD domain-containing protein